MTSLLRNAISALLIALGTTAAARAAALSYDIVDLGYGASPSAISANGQHIGGFADYGDGRLGWAFTYSGSGPLKDLGFWSPSWTSGVNDGAQFVGSVMNPFFPGCAAFLRSGNGGTEDLGTLGGKSSFASAINNNGQIVGDSTTITGNINAFLFAGAGPMRDLGTLGGAESRADDINAAGTVVGRAQTADASWHAFLYSGSGMTDLGSLGGDTYGLGLKISDAGQILGPYVAADGTFRAFLYSDEMMHDLGIALTDANQMNLASISDINSSGQIVGEFGVGDSWHAAIYGSDGARQDLNDLIDPTSGWTLTYASAINNNGQIVGSGTAPDGQPHGFLLTPTPEPSTLALLGVASAAALLALWRRHCRRIGARS